MNPKYYCRPAIMFFTILDAPEIEERGQILWGQALPRPEVPSPRFCDSYAIFQSGNNVPSPYQAETIFLPFTIWNESELKIFLLKRSAVTNIPVEVKANVIGTTTIVKCEMFLLKCWSEGKCRIYQEGQTLNCDKKIASQRKLLHLEDLMFRDTVSSYKTENCVVLQDQKLSIVLHDIKLMIVLQDRKL